MMRLDGGIQAQMVDAWVEIEGLLALREQVNDSEIVMIMVKLSHSIQQHMLIQQHILSLLGTSKMIQVKIIYLMMKDAM